MSNYILIVDDDSDLLDVLELQLAQMGLKSRRANNGKEALDAIREQLPALIVSDLAMPVMNGRKMLQLIRQDPQASQVPVIILSAFGYEWEAELMGAQGHIRKPILHASQLETEITRVLGGAEPRKRKLVN